MIVYLSGRIAGLTYDEANGWRQDVADVLSKAGIQALNPLRSRLFAHADLEEGFNPRELVERDIGDIRDADLVLVYWTGPSIGTACELWEAYRTGVPVILVSSDPTVTKHPWVRVCATQVFTDLDVAVQYICTRAKDIDPDGLPEMWDIGGESSP